MSDPKNPTPAAQQLVDIRCANPACGRLLGKTSGGGVVQIKCPRCAEVTTK